MNLGKILPVIICGGTGSRLWPLSRATYPKQYLKMKADDTLTFFQATIQRISDERFFYNPMVICNEEHRFIVAEQLREIKVKAYSIILEPSGRNTAPAITIASLIANQSIDNPLVLILPADHIIKDELTFLKVINKAKYHAKKGKIITFGITPDKPETGYGYIESKNDLYPQDLNGEEIIRFIEKPDLKSAKNFITDKKFSWNSGIFLFSTNVLLSEVNDNANEILEYCKKAISSINIDLDFYRLDDEAFLKCPNISIDKAIMERTKLGMVFPLKAGWCDVGSWQSMWEFGEKDDSGNVISGEVLIEDSNNSYLRSENKLIVGIGINDLIVVETEDALLITDKKQTQKVKDVVNYLLSQNKSEAKTHKTIFRPWGNYISLANGLNWQVKKIIVKPYESLSLQLHNHRTEHWIVLSGTALVEINGKEEILNKNQSTYIPLGAKHRLTNPSNVPLILIEVQSGDYLGEDDIIRFKDKYGRNN